MSADCVGRGANPRGPRRLPGEWSWGCASVSPPWWAQMEAQGREEGGDPASGESSALRGCFSSPFSGLHGRSLQLLWPRGGHAQSLGESSSQTPSSPLLRRQPSLEHGARGGHTAPLRLPLSPLEPASAPVPLRLLWGRRLDGAAPVRASEESGCEGNPWGSETARFREALQAEPFAFPPPSLASRHCLQTCPLGAGRANTGSERLGAGRPAVP